MQKISARKFHFESPSRFTSLDHLVGEQLDRVGYLDAERPGRLQVDDELEFGRLHDWQVSGLRAIEDAAGIVADLTKPVQNIGSIAHQPTDFDNLASGIGRGNPIAHRERRKLDTPAIIEEPVACDEEGLGAVAR